MVAVAKENISDSPPVRGNLVFEGAPVDSADAWHHARHTRHACLINGRSNKKELGKWQCNYDAGSFDAAETRFCGADAFRDRKDLPVFSTFDIAEPLVEFSLIPRSFVIADQLILRSCEEISSE